MDINKLVFLFLLITSLNSHSEDWTGKVIGVHDGDTLEILYLGKGEKIRLVEIDAPELGQEFGRKSKQSLSDLCFGKDAKVIVSGKDKYNRNLGRVYCEGVDANFWQIQKGMAWFYTKYGNDEILKKAE